ncbi:MAG: hypothetical protein ACPGPS_15440, partial [Rubripirellula sp.]
MASPTCQPAPARWALPESWMLPSHKLDQGSSRQKLSGRLMSLDCYYGCEIYRLHAFQIRVRP